MSGEISDVTHQQQDEGDRPRSERWNYMGRKCLTCGGVLRMTERKYHKGACALAGKTARQKRRRRGKRLRATALSGWPK
jgi:hypothetical protein